MASSRKRNGSVLDGNRKRGNHGDLDGTYEIDVITVTDEINRVTVRDSDTISEIERKIQSNKKSSSSTLINIFIKNLQGRISYYLEVNPLDTIGNVKAKMSDFAHVLVFNGVVIDESSTLAGLNIVNGSTLTRIDMAPHGKIEIFVHTFTQKTISLSGASTDTIANVKSWIMYKEGIPVDEQVLIFNGMALADSGTLSDFDIHEQSALTLMRRSSGFFKIFVKTFEGKVIRVKVHPSNTIGDVKSKIEGEIRIPHDEQELIFDETVLNNIDTVADCNINEESTLTLVRISTGYMRISIIHLDGGTYTMKVKPSTTVDKVKSKFCNIIAVSKSQIIFLFGGRRIGEGLTLAECSIHNESTIYSVLHQTGD